MNGGRMSMQLISVRFNSISHAMFGRGYGCEIYTQWLLPTSVGSRIYWAVRIYDPACTSGQEMTCFSSMEVKL